MPFLHRIGLEKLLLMFLLYVAMLIEGRMTDNDEAFRANTEAVRELQQSFDGMASQMERMRVKAESASAAEQAADAAIAELLVTSRKVVWLLPEQLRLEFVPVLHRLQGRLAAEG